MRFSFAQLATVAASLATLAPAVAKSGPVAVAYVEVNNEPIINVGKYKLTDGSNAFDVAIIFAANINYNGTDAVLFYNPQVTAVLNSASTQIKPLQNQGIKVLLSILGNHEGAGFANFQTKAAAAAFASQLAAAVHKYNLDGIDFDDEYADYGNNGTAQPNNNSMSWLIESLRSQLPNKLITLYNIGPAAESLSSAPASVGEMITYAWNPYYDSYSAPSIPGMNKSSLSPAAVEIGSTPNSDSANFAKMTVQQGYGVYMTYNLASGNETQYITPITSNLYGLNTVYTP